VSARNSNDPLECACRDERCKPFGGAFVYFAGSADFPSVVSHQFLRKWLRRDCGKLHSVPLMQSLSQRAIARALVMSGAFTILPLKTAAWAFHNGPRAFRNNEAVLPRGAPHQ
jgi:hypothetical protein